MRIIGENREKLIPSDSQFEIRFPVSNPGCAQDSEWFTVKQNGEWKRLRMHDYEEIYKIPGLYEKVVYQILRCQSPKRVTQLLGRVLEDWPLSMEELRVFDLGAGNGIVGERFRSLNVNKVVGVDLLLEAKIACDRDRPGTYDYYFAGDLCQIESEELERLEGFHCNCLTTVATLGFGDIPPEVFLKALECISTPGWVAFCIKENFLMEEEASGFSKLIRVLIEQGVLHIQAQHRYCHRVSISGKKLFYIAIVARKEKEIDSGFLNKSNLKERFKGDNGLQFPELIV